MSHENRRQRILENLPLYTFIHSWAGLDEHFFSSLCCISLSILAIQSSFQCKITVWHKAVRVRIIMQQKQVHVQFSKSVKFLCSTHCNATEPGDIALFLSLSIWDEIAAVVTFDCADPIFYFLTDKIKVISRRRALAQWIEIFFYCVIDFSHSSSEKQQQQWHSEREWKMWTKTSSVYTFYTFYTVILIHHQMMKLFFLGLIIDDEL